MSNKNRRTIALLLVLSGLLAAPSSMRGDLISHNYEGFFTSLALLLTLAWASYELWKGTGETAALQKSGRAIFKESIYLLFGISFLFYSLLGLVRGLTSGDLKGAISQLGLFVFIILLVRLFRRERG